MKLCLLLVAIAATFINADDVIVQKRTVKCDSVLAVKVCDRFRNIATSIKLKANVIEEAIKDAYSKGITKAEEVKASVEKFLEKEILSKSCEDLVDKQFCDKLDTVGKYLQKKGDQLKPYLVKAMLEGAALAKDIKAKVEDYIRNDLMKNTCADILPADKCKQIEDIGAALKLKADQIKQATIDSVLKGYNKVQDTVMTTLTSMKKYAENFTCEELLNPDVCVNLRAYAKKIRIGMPKMMNAVRSAIVMGYKVGKGFTTVVYKIADAFIDCEQFLSADNCRRIKSLAAKVGVTAQKVKESIVDAVKKGVIKATDLYKSILNYLKNKFGRRKRSLMEKRDLKAVLEKYKKMLENGIIQAKEYLKKAIAKTLDTMKVVDAKIRAAVEKAILEGKSKYKDIKKLIADMLAKKGSQISKRQAPSLTDLLKKALKKSTGIMKWTIKNLLELTTTQLHTIKRYVQTVLDKVLGTYKRDVEVSVIADESDAMLKEHLKEISNKFALDVDSMMEEIADETSSLIEDISDETRMQKRFIDLDSDGLKEYVTKILKQHVGKAYDKIMAKSKDLMKDIEDALKKAGGSIIDVSKVVLAKINEMLKNVEAGKEF